MPYTIHIDPDVNCAFVKFYGVFTPDQIMSESEDTFNHPGYSVGMNILRDYREQQMSEDVTYKSIATEGKRVMHKFGRQLGRCKAALVAGDVQSYARFHQVIVAGRLADIPVERKAFRDIEKAMRWLDIPEGYEINYPELENAPPHET